MSSSHHQKWLKYCLELGAKGCGYVGSGAMVGSVLVRKGTLIAEAYHEAFGKFHAERNLLLNYKEQLTPQDILYVNLEPCIPSPSKKTPACVDIILEREVKNLVFGMVDPDPRVAGQGAEFLRSKGLNVAGPLLEDESREFNRGFVSIREKGEVFCSLVDSLSCIRPIVSSSAWMINSEQIPTASILLDLSDLTILENLKAKFAEKGKEAVYTSVMPQVLILETDTSPSLDSQLANVLEDLSKTFRAILFSSRQDNVQESSNPSRWQVITISTNNSILSELGISREGFYGVTSTAVFRESKLIDILSAGEFC